VSVKFSSSQNANFRHGLLYGLPVMVYAGLIFLLSSLPQFIEEVSPFIGYDKLLHFMEYYFFGNLICRWLLNKKNYLIRRYAFFITLVIGTCYGVSDEWHQSFIPERVASIWDVLSDAVGIAAAVLTYHITLKTDMSLAKLDKILERKFIHEG
jgi:VanZ family protein